MLAALVQVEQFERAAVAAAPFVVDAALSVGERIHRAVAASMAAAGCNTNLGILLLCVPLAVAAEGVGSIALSPSFRGEGGPAPLRTALAAVLDGLTVADANAVFAAIALANPGGLGRAEHEDVHAPASVTLREAMALAADRDRIARAYVDGFADIFDFALPQFREARRRVPASELAVTDLHMALLAAFPDSHILRKYGEAVAEQVRRDAAAMRDALAAPAPMIVERLMAFDARLKGRRINPGTTADFVVATLFAEQLDVRRAVAETLV